MKPILVFDLDDTLIPSKRIYSQLIEELPQGLSSEVYRKGRELAQSALPDDSPSRFHRLIYLKNAFEVEGRFSAPVLLEAIEVYERKLAQLIQESWAGSSAQFLLAKLKDLGFRMVLLTNETLRTQLIKLAQIDPSGKVFDRVITSEEVGFGKPNLKMFERVQAYFPNQSFIMIGDSLENDIQPARSLGWKTLHVNDCGQIMQIFLDEGLLSVPGSEVK